MKTPRFFQICLGLLAIALALFASGARAADERFVLISHAPDSDLWWNTVKNGLADAAKDFNVQVDYRNPPSGDLADMARLIEQAAARNYDGVIVSIADFDLLKRPVELVRAKGIPIVTINSGTPEQSKKLGAIMHVGQPEYGAGKAAGEKAKAAGIRSYLCANHYATNPVSFDRSRGFGEAIGADYRKSTLDTGDDPSTVENKVSSYLRANPGTEAVLALGPNSAIPALKAIQKMGLAGKIYFATFDMTPEVIKGIKDGTVAFAIDQQPYLQGYVPVAVLALARQQKTTDIAKLQEILQVNPKLQKHLDKYGLAPVYEKGGISSGPGFITKDNVEKVEKYAGEYR
ncbi:MAG TPA: sugar ABC transporter substrate-binding protein [Terrimicrobiaceae bacterium]